MPTTDDGHIVYRLRFDTDGWLVAESTFLTEAEHNGIRERQARLPLECPPNSPPLETAGPLFHQPQEGDNP